MNHPFVASQLNKLECQKCKRNYIAHTKAAICEACGKVASCDIWGSTPDDPRSILMCESCQQKERDIAIKMADSVVKVAESIDDKIRINGDFFNAATIAAIDVKKSILADESLTEPQKLEKYHNFLVGRIDKIRKSVFAIDNKKFELVVHEQAYRKLLIDEGTALRKEVREKLTQQDSLYAPKPIPKVKVDKKIASKSPMEKLIDIVMASKPGTTREEAEKIIATSKS